MRKVTQNQLEAIKQRGGSITVVPKSVTVEGLADVAEQINNMVQSAVQSNAGIAEALADISKTINSKEFKGSDITEIVRTLEGISENLCHPQEFPDFIVDFERDQRGLIKSGMRLRAEYNEC